MATYLLVPLDYPEVTDNVVLFNAPTGLQRFNQSGTEYRVIETYAGREQGLGAHSVIDFNALPTYGYSTAHVTAAGIRTTDIPRNNVNRDFQRRQEEERQRDRQRSIEQRAERALQQAGQRSMNALDPISEEDDFLRRQRDAQEFNMCQAYIGRVFTTGTGGELPAGNARDIFYNPAHYTAGVDPYNATATPNVHVYDRSRLTYQYLEDTIAGITGVPSDRLGAEIANSTSVSRTTTYNMESTVAQYGHLLSAEDQQRLGYVAPAPRPNEERMMTANDNYGMTSAASGWLRDDTVIWHSDTRRSRRSPPRKPDMSAEQAAAELVAEAIQKQQAEADEWLKNSPWG